MARKNNAEPREQISDAAAVAVSVPVAAMPSLESEVITPPLDKGPTLNIAQIVLFAAVIGLGLFFRWYELGYRPIHHDESLHAMYGRYFFDFPEDHFYKYDPMLHGPLLYNMMRAVYSSVGSSDFAARAPIAILGSLFLCLPWVFRRYFTASGLIALTAYAALSPTLIYWSRFLREDFLVLTTLFLGLFAIGVADTRRKWLYFTIAVAVHYCIKASIFVHASLLIGFLLYEFFLVEIVKREKTSCLRNAFGNLIRNQWSFVIGFSIGTIIFWYLYTAGGRYSKGMSEGFYRGFTYWMEQHNKERIEGPFAFHFFQLSWYELPFIVTFFVHMALVYNDAHKTIRYIAIATPVAAALTVLLHFSPESPVHIFWSFFKLKSNIDLLCLFVLVVHAFLVATHHILRGEKILSVAGYAFTALFFTYSYLGEKVPWLSLYPFVAGLIYFTLYFQDYFRRNPSPELRELPFERIFLWFGVALMTLGLVFIVEQSVQGRIFPPFIDIINPFAIPSNIQRAYGPASAALPGNKGFLIAGIFLAVLGWLAPHFRVFGRVDLGKFLFLVVAVYSIRAAIQTNFVFAGRETEFISQVHTTHQLKEWALKVRGEIEYDVAPFRPSVLVTGDPVWPLTWYFRDLPEYKFSSESPEQFKYVFETFEENKVSSDKFDKRKITLRGWWVPDYTQMTLKKYLNYSLNHVPWNPSGFTYTTLLVKKPN